MRQHGRAMLLPSASLVASIAPLLLGLPSPSGGGEFDVLEGLCVERASPLARSLIALCFDPDGRALVSVEDGGILALRDLDGDGFFEGEQLLEDRVRGCQGLCSLPEALYAVGTGPLNSNGSEGAPRDVEEETPGAALFRLRPGEPPRALVRFNEISEHGPHGIAPGPDGALYVVAGDQARILESPSSDSPLLRGYEGALIEPFLDPSGFATSARYPHGFIARVDRESGEWRYHSVGYRNPYDLAFDERGELLTVDSDMEWDIGLPWYEPVRAVHAVPSGDYGRRGGSLNWPSHYADTLPALAELGRGSPTGLLVVQSDALPSLRGALIVGDWARGRILALRLAPSGATYQLEEEIELVAARSPLNVTDLAVGRDGAIYFTTGGRGTIGGFYRIEACTPPEGAQAGTGEEARGSAAEVPPAFLRRRSLAEAGERASSPQAIDELFAALADPDRFIRYAARSSLERLCAGELMEDFERRVLAEKNPRAALEGLVLLARVKILGADRGSVRSWSERAAALLLGETDEDLILTALRVLELCSLSEPASLDAHEGDLVELLPSLGPSAAREAALLLARRNSSAAIQPLLERMQSSPAREDALHAACCLQAITAGWTSPQRQAFFGRFEEMLSWSGGGSFGGYLEAMLERCVRAVEPEEALALAESSALGPRVLASFVAHSDDGTSQALLPFLREAYSAKGESEAFGNSGRAAVLRSLSGRMLPGMPEWLREIYEDEPRRRDEVLVALASYADPLDAALFLKGLERRTAEVPEACARALRASGSRPEDPKVFRTVLDAARMHGPPRSEPLLALLGDWAQQRFEGPDAIARCEAWLFKTFPELKAEDEAVVQPPLRDIPQMAAFLERSKDRAGSAAFGAAVYAKAGCSACHVLGPVHADSGYGLGPDLTTAASRFSQLELLEAIAQPSLFVSDPYRTVLVETDERTFEGRLVEDTPASLTLLLSDGSRHHFERESILSAERSTRSLMPDGLLAGLSLGELKDLFAFFAAEGIVPPEQLADRPWISLLPGGGHGGWDGRGKHWRSSGELLIGKSRGLTESVYLLSADEYRDFEVEFDARLSKDANSGFQYRSRIESGAADPIGYQADMGQSYWGSLYATDGRGVLAQPRRRLQREAIDPEGWNHFLVTVRGDHHRIEINGALMIEFRDGAHVLGRIGFQLHAGEPMQVWIANPRVRALD